MEFKDKNMVTKLPLISRRSFENSYAVDRH